MIFSLVPPASEGEWTEEGKMVKEHSRVLLRNGQSPRGGSEDHDEGGLETFLV